jgi:energy-coupling factor transport system ATP-binding protein
MVRLDNICFGYDDADSNCKSGLLLDNVSFCVEDGGLFGISGRSGCGKTSLAKLICGLLKPVSGSISVSSTPRMVMQFPERQLFARTVLDDVMYGPLNLGIGKEQAREIAVSTLDRLGLDRKLYDRSPFSLSGGEKRLAAIAGILAMDPDILVLDEPTAGLDACGESALVSILSDLHSEGRTIIIVSHDDALLNSLCTGSFSLS